MNIQYLLKLLQGRSFAHFGSVALCAFFQAELFLRLLFYGASKAGQAGWHDGWDDPAAFVKFWLEAVLSASLRLEASLG